MEIWEPIADLASVGSSPEVVHGKDPAAQASGQDTTAHDSKTGPLPFGALEDGWEWQLSFHEGRFRCHLS